MASGIFSSLKALLANHEILNGIHKTCMGGTFSRCFSRTLSSSNRTTNYNESMDNIQHGNTPEHNTKHFVNVVGDDCNNIPRTENSAEALQETQSDTGHIPIEQFKIGDAGIEETKTINYDNLASMLVEELGYVYSRYRENNMEDVLKEQIGMTTDESSEVINRAKELFLKSLREAELSQENQNVGITEDIQPIKAEQVKPKQDFLGIKTVYGDLLRPFSTSAALGKDDKGKKTDCDKAKKLPCLQVTEVTGVKPQATSSKGACERFCMPCCKPARDPPICFYPYKKPPCNIKKPPRAAFSECKHIFPLMYQPPCECIRPPVGSCKKSKESAKCGK